MSNRHAAILKITTVALAELLKLPEGARIRAVHQQPADQLNETVQILIEHPDLPEVAEGTTPPATDIFYTQGDEHANFFLLI